MRVALRRYQDESVEFQRARRCSILGHEPGLGKSAISIVAADLPALVICPASLMINWEREVELWRPRAIDGFRMVSYAYPELEDLEWRGYKTLIVDEVHYIKNPEALRSRLVCGLIRRMGRRGRVFALSGTIMPNRPIELWALLYAMEITDLEWVDFAFRYADAWEDERYELNVSGASNVDELRELLEPHCLRFTKRDVLPELPDKTWRVVALDLPVDEREKEFSLRDLRRMDEMVAFEALSDVLHLHGQRKIPLVVEHVRDLMESVNKVIVFGHHRDVITALAGAFKEYGPEIVMGGQSRKRKQLSIDRFQERSASRLLIGQIQAAGHGHNLTAASHVVFAEGTWVPGDLEQAADRAHRIGTKGNVTVDLLTIHRSIDEHMIHRALEKQGVIDLVVPENRHCIP